jgi:hypothetical protein
MTPASLVLVLAIAVLAAGCAIVAKRIADRGSITAQARLFFAVNVAVSLAVSAAYGRPDFSALTFLIFMLGMGNAAAAVSQFRAYRESLALASLFLVVPDVVAIFLAVGLLGELRYLSAPVVAGIVMIAGAVLAIRFDSSALSKTVSRSFWLSVGLFCFLWGLVAFFDRFSAVSGIKAPAYLLLWYGGSFIGSLVIHRVSPDAEKHAPLSRVNVADALLFAALAWGTRLFGYLLFSLNPLVIAAPLRQIIEALVPLGVAVTVYHEHALMSARKRWAVVTALCGAVFVVYGVAG